MIVDGSGSGGDNSGIGRMAGVGNGRIECMYHIDCV